ncbi:MAG: aminotransferase class III-fold pyridoxal phosphate-dependent enzyme [Deltaproteobacteria bacterium]|nr:aminotransferase class III-fold pyridoxal phosphate-dependent enzyme [bacterium]MCB9476053.1 aminotransferase class III-fold pyridoxal phosphate-dependent enzyme [Deltaproteobacteria bacterium]MCB9478257.1 aminotransferase class III-fold pyridoxal phosphate-dependent enzyme [Deltaproteobacteria bacterium]MCB9487190.1 aminotransferase class III-fold pyridoxal phosphate-dependent enzyme [Deltaproteobacteria bacterium]
MEIFSRAVKVVPQGIYGHQSPALTVPGEFPYYAASGKGPRYTDVDGNEFIDYMCAYGPMIVGYANDEVNAAAIEAMQQGDCFNHPSELMVKLAERMVESIPHADWAVFGKNGSDMTTWATMVAREHTDRRKIVMVKGTYHGIHAWCTPGHGGLINADRENMLYFEWNRLDQLEELFRRQGDDIAGVIMTPYHHPAMAGSILPAEGFWKGVQKLCNDNGAVLILDDVRCGWRLSFHGSQDYFGFEPDLSCYCKAIGNGFPISAAVGREELKTSAAKVFLTGSYWNGAMCMNAALKCLEILEREKAVEHMFAMGERLNKGLEELGDKYGYPMKMTGPATMGYLVLDDDPDLYKIQRFCAEVTKRGSFFHPHHNWFLSAAHTAADIDETLGQCEDALKAMG